MPPLLLAAQQGHATTVQLLAEQGASLDVRDERGNNLSLAAAVSGVADALRTALELAPVVDVQNERGQTPLHRVLLRTEGPALTAMLEVLAEHGARIDIPDQNGKTAADLAAAEHFPGAAEFRRLFPPLQSALR